MLALAPMKDMPMLKENGIGLEILIKILRSPKVSGFTMLNMMTTPGLVRGTHQRMNHLTPAKITGKLLRRMRRDSESRKKVGSDMKLTR